MPVSACAAIDEGYARNPVRFWQADPARWRRLMDINVAGPFLMARAAVPHMITQGAGRIVNVTTSLDTMLAAGMAPYGPSKAALEAGTAVWAKDLAGTGVTANVLVPGGPVDSAFLSPDTQFPRDKTDQAGNHADADRLGSPRQVPKASPGVASSRGYGIPTLPPQRGFRTGRRASCLGGLWRPGGAARLSEPDAAGSL